MSIASIILLFMISLKLAHWKVNALPRPIAFAIQWLHAIVLECVLLGWVQMQRISRYFPSHQKGIGSCGGQPILLIHGYLHDSSAWNYHVRKLIRAGLGPIYRIDLRSRYLPIHRYAEQVYEKAKSIAQETGKKDLCLVGHSMGGLIGAYYAMNLAPVGSVSAVITLGSPLQGTHMARFSFGASGKEMRKDSPFVRKLQESFSQKSSVDFYHLGTQTDLLVIPSASAIANEAAVHRVMLSGIGHLTLLFSSRVASQIIEWVRPLETASSLIRDT